MQKANSMLIPKYLGSFLVEKISVVQLMSIPAPKVWKAKRPLMVKLLERSMIWPLIRRFATNTILNPILNTSMSCISLFRTTDNIMPEVKKIPNIIFNSNRLPDLTVRKKKMVKKHMFILVTKRTSVL